jgi:hypothetical protein
MTYTANAGSLFFLGSGLCHIIEKKKFWGRISFSQKIRKSGLTKRKYA